jgi:hypothetical protein
VCQAICAKLWTGKMQLWDLNPGPSTSNPTKESSWASNYLGGKCLSP